MSNLVDGRYQLIDVIGAGGMATVWRAQDLRLNRMVALKRPRVTNNGPADGQAPQSPSADGALDASTLQARMSREMQLAASLSHPNLVTVHDAGHDGDGLYLVMELVEAPSLAEELSRSGRMDRIRCLTVGAEIADALATVHRVGIVHRDVKPGNILLADAGAKLTDFGIATANSAASAEVTSQTSLTMAGSILGTLNYASPEVLAGEPPTDRSDVYSLAAVVYQMFTGQLPFPDNGRMNLPSPSGDAGLDATFAEALAHDAWRRPDAATLGARLRSAMAPASSALPPASPPPPAARPPADTTAELPSPILGAAPAPVPPAGSTQMLPPHLQPDVSVPSQPRPAPGPPVVGRPMFTGPDQPAPPARGSRPQGTGGGTGNGRGRNGAAAVAVAAAVILLAGYLIVRAFQPTDSVEATGQETEEGDGNGVDAGEGEDITPQTLPPTTTTVEVEPDSDEESGEPADGESDDGDPLSQTLDELEDALERADEEFDDSGLPSEEVDDLLDRAREAIDSARDSEELDTVRRLDDLRRRIDDAVGDEESDDSAAGRFERLARLLGFGDEDPADGSGEDDAESEGDGG